MRKWNLPLTYAPKITGVLDGSIRQPIRAGRKFSVGDLVSFHGWEGKPYRSKWSFRTPYAPLAVAQDIIIYSGGIAFLDLNGDIMLYDGWRKLNRIAELDGISPPTGQALWGVLTAMHRIPDGGIEAQIIRW
ncbi:MAG: hypothetical protein PHS18_04165 [Sphaerochaetaceae bacterium]|nr:hypothetical protein [Sphaerochaetaceae bacterium]